MTHSFSLAIEQTQAFSLSIERAIVEASLAIEQEQAFSLERT